MSSDSRFSRRTFVAALPFMAMATQLGSARPAEAFLEELFGGLSSGRHYGARPNERFPIPALSFETVNPNYLRRTIRYSGPGKPGTLVVNTRERYLYHVLPGGRADRYGVGVGKQGMAWRGSAYVGRKAEWPGWTPTQSMIAREPRYARWAGGMRPGLQNPLGARALYLYRNGRDTMYRIHGTNEPGSVGRFVSSGCIRMINHDVIELFNQVPVGTRVVVT